MFTLGFAHCKSFGRSALGRKSNESPTVLGRFRALENVWLAMLFRGLLSQPWLRGSGVSPRSAFAMRFT